MGFRAARKYGNVARFPKSLTGVPQNPSDVEKLAHLARLEISADTIAEVSRSVTEVLKLVDQLQAVNTEGVAPMAHPLDAVQILRADVVTETDQRERFQAIAPATEDGLYLVPKVIE